jgi:Icc-related predicted phosphoesterase
MKIVAISDTHALHRSVIIPPGDILVHAGDITGHGAMDEVRDFNALLGTLPHRHKIVIAGNHDFCFEKDPVASRAALTNCIYLQDEEVEVGGIRFYGSPWQPWFFDWAFNLQRGAEIRAKWDLIPEETDVLITHGPPKGHGDVTCRGEAVGCDDLLEAVERIQPRVHVFGHIHEGVGITSNGTTTFINASTCDLAYRPVNPPLVHLYEV